MFAVSHDRVWAENSLILIERSYPSMSRRLLSLVLAGALLGGVVVSGNVSAAIAEPSYPSWDDVLAARSDSTAAEAKIADIQNLIAALNHTADSAGQHALEAGERAQVAEVKRAAAATEAEDLEARLGTARQEAAGAKRYLGAAAAALARTGTHSTVESLVSSSGHADDLLYRLGALEKVTGARNQSYTRAQQAVGEVTSLSAQSAVVERKLSDAAAAQQAAAAEATAAAQRAQDAVQAQQAHGVELNAQLTVLRDRSANVEEQYTAGVAARAEAQRRADEARAAAAQAEEDRRAAARAEAEQAAQRARAAANRPGARPSGTGKTRPGPTWRPTPQPPRPAPSPKPDSPRPGRPGPVVPHPAPGGAAASAVRFARAQLGKWYVFGGEGPSTWDCSGLTMIAYRQAGVTIGAHTVGAQYRYLSAAGLLAPTSGGLRPGDLLFYNQGASTTSFSMYHVTIYVGDGLMIEAPQPGERVKISPVRTRNLVPYAGRPA